MGYRTRRAGIEIALGLLLACCLPHAAQAAELTPGNVLVSLTVAGYDTLTEYTTTGGIVQSVEVPYPVPPRPSGEDIRDSIVLPCGQVAIFNGTSDPYMTRWTPSTGGWSHQTYEGWSTVANISYGGIAAWQNYVFVTDMATGNGPDVPAGIIRFDTAAGTATRYWENVDFVDVTLGWNGLLYALRPGGRSVWVFDPLTMNGRLGFTLDAACAGIAVDADGVVFGASTDGNLYRFNLTGDLLDTLSTGLAGGLTDIDLAADGSLVAGSRIGWVITSDTSLQSFDGFRAHPYLPTFVSFTTPVPEPGVAAAVLLGLGLVVRRR